MLLLLLGQHCRAARGRLALEADGGDITMAVRAGLLPTLLLHKARLDGDSRSDAVCAICAGVVFLQGLVGERSREQEPASCWSTTPSTAGIRDLPAGLLLLLPHLLRMRSQSCVQQHGYEGLEALHTRWPAV